MCSSSEIDCCSCFMACFSVIMDNDHSPLSQSQHESHLHFGLADSVLQKSEITRVCYWSMVLIWMPLNALNLHTFMQYSSPAHLPQAHEPTAHTSSHLLVIKIQEPPQKNTSSLSFVPGPAFTSHLLRCVCIPPSVARPTASSCIIPLFIWLHVAQ